MTALAWYVLRGPAKLAAMADRPHAACLNMLATPNGNERLKAPAASPPCRIPPAPGAVEASEVDRWTEQARAASATAELFLRLVWAMLCCDVYPTVIN